MGSSEAIRWENMISKEYTSGRSEKVRRKRYNEETMLLLADPVCAWSVFMCLSTVSQSETVLLHNLEVLRFSERHENILHDCSEQ